MKKHYARIILGASYYALGYESSHEDCLILEQSQTVGSEFHLAVRPVTVRDGASGPMCDIMREYGVLTPGTFDQLKAQAVVHEYASRRLEEGMQLVLDAHIISVSFSDEGVSVSFIDNEGISTVTAERLIDTTDECVSVAGMVKCVSKTLNAFTVALSDGFTEKLTTVHPECRVIDGSMENEKIICFAVSPDTSLAEAYRELVDVWSKAFPEGEEKILFVAENFDAVYEPVKEKPRGWVGRYYDDPFTAFAEGAVAE